MLIVLRNLQFGQGLKGDLYLLCHHLPGLELSEGSVTPQFKGINSSVLSLLHSPILTSIHDHRKSHSLD